MNKEFGSGFHYIYTEKGQSSFFSEKNRFNLFFSGRAALYNLIQFGITKKGWKKIGFPSFYCHEIIKFFRKLTIEIVLYDYNPMKNNDIIWEDNPGNVIVNVNFFGIRKADLSFLKNTIIIEDVTHDLLSVENSSADYCFASLRKQLPLGVGGFCTLKENESFEDNIETTLVAKQTYQKVSTAMFLKTEYLQNRLENNDLYRKYYQEAEEIFGDHLTNSILPEQAMTHLLTFPVENLISTTKRNISQGIVMIKASEAFKIIKNAFMLILYCKNSEIRDQLRKYLIENKIFPAILWPNQILEQDKDLERRILCIHMDFRYSLEEIEYISNKINSFFENV